MAKMGLNASELARKCSIQQRTMSNYLLGNTEPSFDAQEKIAAALGVPAWYLLVEDASQISPQDKVKVAVLQTRMTSNLEKRKYTRKVLEAALEGYTAAEVIDIVKGILPTREAVEKVYGTDDSEWPEEARRLHRGASHD